MTSPAHGPDLKRLIAREQRMAAREHVESPCTKICYIDSASGLCEGCGRSRDEIASWLTLSVEARRQIMAGLPARLAGKGSNS